MRMDVNLIKVPLNRMRKIDKKAVEAMAESMGQRGLISPIVVNDGTLVAGAHRLEAAKMLGWDTINTTSDGNIQVQASLDLIELDENFCRKELTATEKIHHAARRVELVAELKLAGIIIEVAKAKVESGHIGKKSADAIIENQQETDKPCPKVADFNANQKSVIKGAKAKAQASAIKETAAIMKTDSTHIRAAVRDSKALDDAGLDQEELNKLNGAQVKQVAKAAKESPEKAKQELEEQATKPKEKKNGQNASVLDHDSSAYVKDQIQKVRQVISVLTRPKFLKMLDLSEHDKECIYDCIESAEMVIKILKDQAEG